jgi:hypothetical protein
MHEELHRYTRPCTYPYLHGVYLAVNAVPDLHLIVDAPQCAFSKAEQIFGTHDLMSTLVDTSSRHRIAHTRLHVDNIIEANKEGFVSLLRRMVAAPWVKAILYTSFPMASLIGSPYPNWCAEVPGIEGKLVAEVPGRSLEADWLAGYRDTLRVLAEVIPLPPAAPDPSMVAVVGYFMDRNEEDHHGNLRELRRLLAGLSLDLCSVWLGGEPIEQLARVAEAGVILAFPHGRAAAAALARRTGARVIECELPFGVDATCRWLQQVGEATGHAVEAEQVIDRGLAECVPKLKWIIPKRLVSTSWGFAGDPVLIPGLCEIAAYVGARLGVLLAWTIEAPKWDRPVELPVPCRHNLFRGQLIDGYRQELAGLDLMIGTDAVGQDGLPGACRLLEFGFSSRHHHALYDAPFLGFAGLRCFLTRIANFLEDQDD